MYAYLRRVPGFLPGPPLISRPDYSSEQHIGAVAVVVRGALSPDDGTLTRSFKLRRDAVRDAYSTEVKALMARLR